MMPMISMMPCSPNFSITRRDQNILNRQENHVSRRISR
jgi:hypothetical protein